MTCYDVRAKLSALLDRAVGAEEKGDLTRHVDACADCRAELEALAGTDRVLRQAMKVAVETSAPSGYFEAFVARVMERAEPPASEQHEQDKQEVGSMDLTTKPTPKVEMTGLHDLQSMARTTKERLAQKDPDAEADLMSAVASSGSFGRVVLPEPGREVASVPVAAPRAATAAPSMQMAATTGFGSGIVARRPSRVPAFLLGTVAVVGLGAAAAWYLVPRYLVKGQAEQQVASAPAVEPLEDKAAEEAPPSTPVAAQPAPAVTPLEEKPAEPVADEGLALAEPARRAKAEKKERERDNKERPKAKDDEKEAAAAPAAPPPPAAAKPAGAKKDEPQDLDTLLNDATKGAPGAGGGGAAPTETAPAEKPDEKLPESLTSQQVREGMSLVKARVQACYTQYKEPGLVEIKVKIDRDGSIASADAVGKFGATETGLCVANAVKHASFPRFSGPPMNLTYPFRLQ